MRRIILSVMSCFCLAGHVSAADDICYVQGTSAKIYAEPSLLARVLGEAGRGSALSSSGKQGNWFKVRFANADGFVSAHAVASSPPRDKKASQLISDGQAQLSSFSRSRARTPGGQSIVAGIRGLAYEDRARSSKGERSNFTDLELMESVAIDPVELKAFSPGGSK